MSRIKDLYGLGQSIWLDYIERNMVNSGKLADLVEAGVAGVTSNPTIFQHAITKSDAYKEDMQRLAGSDKDPKTIFETLAIADIQAAADVLRTVYDRENRKDGFVSIEVAPDLAYDMDGTMTEVQRLFGAVNRPNVMVKVPATEPGVHVIRQMISEGININVTLIFALDRYAAVKEAYLSGLEERVKRGQPISHIASVASFFVSRVDTNVDNRLAKLLSDKPGQAKEIKALMGKAAIANAKLAYRQFGQVFAGPRWQKLAEAGAQLQRPLWASTSVKNPDYPDLMYVDSLMGPHTVDTIPPQTLDAFRDHGKVMRTVDQNVADAERVLAALADLGISMQEVTDELEKEGVQKFADSYNDLLDAIARHKKEIVTA